jgi:hypothetical protein
MLIRPSHILSPPDITDPNFPAKCTAWTNDMRAEMQETIARTKVTIIESRTIMAEIERQFACK